MENSIIKNKIEHLSKIIDNFIQQTNGKTIQRFRKIETAHIIYCLVLKVFYQMSYQDATSLMVDRGFINNVSFQALNKKILSGQYDEHIKNLNQTLLSQLFGLQNTNQIQTIAIDGSKIRLPISLDQKGFKRIGKQPYTTGLLSTLYNLDLHVPISYRLEKNLNERVVLQSQVQEIDQNNLCSRSIIVGDRGYYSAKLISSLSKCHKEFIFRLPKSLKLVKELKKSGKDDIIVNMENNDVRLIHYQLKKIKPLWIKASKGSTKPYEIVNTNDYYLITSLTDYHTYPIEQIIDMYHQRWDIEEYYKTIKSQFENGTISSRTEEGILSEIMVHQMGMILLSFFNSLLPQYEQYKINQKVLLSRIVDSFLPKILFGKQPITSTIIDPIESIITNLETVKHYIHVRPGRTYPREQRFHSGKFPTTKILERFTLESSIQPKF